MILQQRRNTSSPTMSAWSAGQLRMRAYLCSLLVGEALFSSLLWVL